MKFFNVEVKPVDGTFHTIGGKLLDSPSSAPERLYYVNLTTADRMTAVIEFEGVPDELAARLADADSAYHHEVFATEGDRFYLYLVSEPTGLARKLLRITDRYDIVVETPMDITEHGGLDISVAGPLDRVKTALDEFPYREVRTNVKQVSEFDPNTDSALPQLTPTQRDILETAVELGYYRIPRETSQEEIAVRHDCSAPTIGEHLRKIENRILGSMIE